MTKFCRWDFKHHFWNDCFSKGPCDQSFEGTNNWFLRSKTAELFGYLSEDKWACSILHLLQKTSCTRSLQGSETSWNTKCALFSNLLIYQLNNIFSSSMSDLCSFPTFVSLVEYWCSWQKQQQQKEQTSLREERRAGKHREGKKGNKNAHNHCLYWNASSANDRPDLFPLH